MANRLSELHDISVAVIEAGGEAENNPNVTAVDGYSRSFGTSIDWKYSTTHQKYATGRQISIPSGKALGGSSTINGVYSGIEFRHG